MKQIFVLALACFLASGCHSTTRNQLGNSSTESKVASSGALKVIDAHMHTRFNGKPEEISKIPYTLEQLLKEQKEAGIVASLSLQYNHRDKNPDLRAHNIYYCGGIRENVDYKLLEKQIKSKEIICLKIYLGYVHKWASDPFYTPAYKLAEKYQIPVIFHTGDTYDPDGMLKMADPLTIDEVAVKYRKVNFVIAHIGNPWYQTASEVAYKNANVYVEASGLFVGDMIEYTFDFIEMFMIKPLKWVQFYCEDPKKIMFGTDWPLVPLATYLKYYKMAIPEENWNLVFYENAKRIFNLPIN